jgi:hypothetical protein
MAGALLLNDTIGKGTGSVNSFNLCADVTDAHPDNDLRRRRNRRNQLQIGVSAAFLEISQDRPPVWGELDLRIRRGGQLAAFGRHSFIEHGDAFIAEVELL